MFKNYLVTAFRNLRRQPGYAAINILGLSVGLACSFLIVLWVQGELSFDRFHRQGDQLYVAKRHAYFQDGQVFTWISVQKQVSHVLEEQYPEVQDAEMVSFQNDAVITVDNESFREEGYWADPAFFEMFSFPLIEGNPETVIDEPNSIVLSEALAARLFGADWQSEGVVGRSVRVDNRIDLQVTGVAATAPKNSTLQFDFVIAAQEFYDRNGWVEAWGNSGMQLFVRLQSGTDLDALNAKIKNIIRENHEGQDADVFLQPFEDMYLYGRYENGKPAGGRIDYVRIFIIVAGFILLIACINFMNLATARSTNRTREIGVRKSIGATRGSLVRQFFGESMLMAALAFVLAMLFVIAALPGFNAITGKSIGLADFSRGTLLLFTGIALLTGLVAGSYPAVYLSSFDVMHVFRKSSDRRAGHNLLRKGLVVFQFALSVVFIIGTVTIARQIDYIRTKNLGLDKDHLLFTTLEGPMGDQFVAFRSELLQQPGIAAVTAASQNPLNVGQSTTDPTWDGKDSDADILFHIINSRYDFIETMKMNIVQGRSHSMDYGADSTNYVINQAAARAMGMTDPVGQRLSFWGDEGTIIGVVEDFHMASLHSEIEPTIIRLDPEQTGMLFVRSYPGQTAEAVESLKALHAQFNPSYPFEYRFLDEQYNRMYEAEIVMGTLATIFAGLAIFIACLGLFGLASFTAEQRTKEIGIRKVLGAREPGIVALLLRDFIALVVIGIVIASPLAYFGMKQWLGEFVYHIDIGPAIFVLASLLAIVIATVTVSYQSIRAALANPVDALRSD